jgi:hypothetical protein
VLGGYENTDHFVLSVRAAAIEARSVVMAGISPPLNEGQDMEQASHERELRVCCPCGTG